MPVLDFLIDGPGKPAPHIFTPWTTMSPRLLESVLNSVSTPDGVINYRLTRSVKRKKTMQICIRPPGEVAIFAPVSYSSRIIECFLARKAQWIMKKLDMFNNRENLRVKNSSKDLQSLYLGRAYPVIWRSSQEKWGRIYFDDGGWVVQVPVSVDLAQYPPYAINFLLKWYKSRAKVILDERVVKYAGLLGVPSPQVFIRSPKRLWGSCHPTKRILHFNWKIIMAPLETVDYIVVHELSHITVPNHSKMFWNRVHEFFPDFKEHHAWLKLNGHSLELPLRF
mgnify:CR=1 FL=1